MKLVYLDSKHRSLTSLFLRLLKQVHLIPFQVGVTWMYGVAESLPQLYWGVGVAASVSSIISTVAVLYLCTRVKSHI